MLKNFFYFSVVIFLLACNDRPEDIDSGYSEFEVYCSPACYFFDSELGDDNNSGTNEESPFKSLSKILELEIESGSSLYLRKGRTWEESLILPRGSFYVANYGEGEKPKLLGSKKIERLWGQITEDIYFVALTINENEELGHVSKNGEVMTFAQWNTDLETTFASSPYESFSIDPSNNQIYIKESSDPSNHEYSYSRFPYGVYSEYSSRVYIRDLQIEGFSRAGVFMLDCYECSVYGTDIDGIGGAWADSFYYGAGIKIEESFDYGYLGNNSVSNVYGSCVDLSIYESGYLDETTHISGNEISYCGYSGIRVFYSHIENSGQHEPKKIRISETVVSDVGNSWSGNLLGDGIHIELDDATVQFLELSITGIIVSQNQNHGISVDGEIDELYISYSEIFDNAKSGIYFEDETGVGSVAKVETSLIYNNAEDGIVLNCPYCSTATVHHNSLNDNGVSNITISEIGDGLDIRNNILNNQANIPDLKIQDTLIPSQISHNCYQNREGMFDLEGTKYSTLADFQGLGFESGSASGDISWVSSEQGDFQLNENSICRDIADVFIAIRYDKNCKRYSAPRSAGAYEFLTPEDASSGTGTWCY